ncbi:Early growth response protein 1 (Egr-1) [Colletotrichum higginsianum IMI 349063]|uniref:Early growth response protein 1 (Egr-1) n=1 Tax=Colletotrichum higginsianum (strain IMI 349063) TaxID=759273 RepID=A0A1B7YWU0_COLHI|nr:Early growth response protein 1 (Egr-1) [Colletotrichum higginsianum IMI 349063]OBR16507.1 Early growth response protein 1 (Egr-1) [Colletotrichum higginsianum IMI 349063]
MSMSSVAMDESLPRPFKCATCKKGFTRQENLKRHVNTQAEMLPAFPATSAVRASLEGPSTKARRSTEYALETTDTDRWNSDLRKRHVENCHVSLGSPPKTAPPPPQPSTTPNVNVTVGDSPSTAAWMDVLLTHPPPPPPPPPPQSEMMDPMSQVNQSYNNTQSAMSSEIRCVEAFFDCFHRNFPILHEGSFHIVSTQVPLLNVITAIGSLYCESTFDESTRKAVFESTLSSLQQYVEQNRSRYQETWVLQTFLLLEFLGIYGGNDSSFLKAQRIHRDLIDAIRLLQMSQDSSLDSLSTNSGGEDSGYGEECDEDDMQEPVSADALNDQWQGFIKKESRKRCVYMLYLLDSQLAILCNLRPMLSSLEIKYDLPCCEDIWLARSDRDWYERRRQRFKSFDEPDDNAYAHETPPSQGFFYEASQTLLHSGRGDDKDAGGGKNQPRKLRLLWASPFAAVILVTQLQMMARELTHASCLLERPKAQRRALSILTDKQHAQISQALKGIAELVPRNQKPVFSFFDFGRMDTLLPDSSDQTPLWHTFWILWYYTSITLSHPDSLLVSGVVESNLPLAIATAGHLATPRSKDKRDIYEDRDVFRILNDLELALDLLNPSKSTAPPSLENPFITLLGFKICLVGWRLVRLTMPAAQRSSDALHGPGGMGIGMAINTNGRSNPSRFVLDAIMACVDSVGDDDVENAAAALAMLDGGPVDLARSEVRFLEWIVANFNKRTTWPVGKWVATVMEESLSKAREAYAVPMSE